MNRINPDIDIVQDVLKAVLVAKPDSTFVKSLLQQYQERGGLSKKQLQGLHQKALKVPEIPPNKLATLEAIMLKKATRSKAIVSSVLPEKQKDEKLGDMLKDILALHSQHKRVLFLQSKYDNEEIMTPVEISEVQKFHRLLIKS